MPLEVGQVFTNPRTGATMTVVELSDERACIERLIKPGTGKADGHVHMDFEQRFEVVSGTVRCRIGKEAERELGAGGSSDVPRGVSHRDPYNASGSDAVWRNVITPVPYFARVYMATYGELLSQDALDAQDEFKPLQLFTVLRASRSRSFREGIPIPVQKAMLPLLAAIGRLAGNRAVTG